MVRRPIANGNFYPSSKRELLQEIKECFSSKFGSGKKEEYGNAIGGIVPHAGYVYSGACASHVYSNIIKDIETIVILGANHSGLGGEVSISDEVWETPLGQVEVDETIIKKLVDKGFVIDNKPHKFEHSIEVQLPFIQFKFPRVKIVPIVVSHRATLETMKKLAQVLAKEKAVFIASSDFTHYGYRFDFLPFEGEREKVRAGLYKIDLQLIDTIQKLDTEEFIKQASKTTICGTNAVATLIEISKIKKLKPKLLQYYTSGDLIGDYTSVVSYASLAFEPAKTNKKSETNKKEAKTKR